MPGPGVAGMAERRRWGKRMIEGEDREEAPEGGTENAGTADQLHEAETGGEHTNPAQGTPPIEGGGKPGQTQTPAPDDDVGVPEEIGDDHPE